jgi:hypothetical protein
MTETTIDLETPRIIRGAGWHHARGRFAGYCVRDGAIRVELGERAVDAFDNERRAARPSYGRLDGTLYVRTELERGDRIARLLTIREEEGRKWSATDPRPTFSPALFWSRVADREEDLAR